MEFAKTGVSVDEAALYLELQSRSATEIGSLISSNRPGAIDALRPLVENGFVVRGRVARCPTCSFAEFRRLDELDEHIRCGSCRESFLLPLTVAESSQEPPTEFQLDGLMARVIDQDVLPVLLALRRLQRTFGSGEQPTYACPGVEFDVAGNRTDAELLTD
jgi:hypothetical protein